MNTCCTLSLFLTATMASLPAADVDHHLKVTIDTVAFGFYSATRAPVLTVKLGELVKVDTVQMSGVPDQNAEAFYREHGIDLNNEAVQDILSLQAALAKPGMPPRRGPALTGPIAIEGAEPGDMLEVRVHSIRFRANYGVNSTRPGGSTPLGDLVPRPWSELYHVDPERNVAIFSDGIEIPLQPHLGQMGVAPPPEVGELRSGPPTNIHGGNFDLREITTGATLYLPVNVAGGMFSTGDAHALQGNGEVTGFSIECNLEGIFEFHIHKGVKLAVPRVETPTHYITLGIGDELDAAMRAATIDSQAFLKEKEGMDFFTSYSFLSLGADFCITRALRPGQMIHVMIPKSYFITVQPDYWYHGPLRNAQTAAFGGIAGVR